MGDLTDKESSGITRITGDDEQFAADVIFEDNFKKLLVKSTTVPDTLPNLQFLKATNGGSSDLNVNGSSTPVVFTIMAQGSGGNDLIIRELRISGSDNGVKVDNFMALNSPITNGILINIYTNGGVSSFEPIKNTAEFESNFAYGAGGKFNLLVGSGSDYVTATFSPASPFKLIAGSSDKIEVVIRDNLNQVNSLKFTAFAIEDI